MAWQKKFDSALINYLQIFSRNPKSNHDIKYEIDQLSNKERRGIWGCVSKYLNILPQEARDYYHNHWTRELCDPFRQYTEQINKIIEEEALKYDSKKEIINSVVNSIITTFNSKQFHMMTLKQHIHHQLDKNEKFRPEQQYSMKDPLAKEEDKILELLKNIVDHIEKH